MASKILLADDSITIQKVVNLTFADEGIDVVTVGNGEMAERRLVEINPDLVLADIFMPGKNGYELCQYVKQHPDFKDTPVVLLIGAFEPFDQNEARRVRADAHLTKPFESRVLVDTVRKLIQNKRPTGSLKKPETGATKPLSAMPAEQSPFSIDLSNLDSNFPSTNQTMVMGSSTAQPDFALTDTAPTPAPASNEPAFGGGFEGWNDADSDIFSTGGLNLSAAPSTPSFGADPAPFAVGDLAPTADAPVSDSKPAAASAGEGMDFQFPSPAVEQTTQSAEVATGQPEASADPFGFLEPPAQSSGQTAPAAPASAPSASAEGFDFGFEAWGNKPEPGAVEFPQPAAQSDAFSQAPLLDVDAAPLSASAAFEAPPASAPFGEAQGSASYETTPIPAAPLTPVAQTSVPTVESGTPWQDWKAESQTSPEAAESDSGTYKEVVAEPVQSGLMAEDDPLGDVFLEHDSHQVPATIEFSPKGEFGHSVGNGFSRRVTGDLAIGKIQEPPFTGAPDSWTGSMPTAGASGASDVGRDTDNQFDSSFGFAPIEAHGAPVANDPSALDVFSEDAVPQVAGASGPLGAHAAAERATGGLRLPAAQFTASDMWAGDDASFSPINVDVEPVASPAITSFDPAPMPGPAGSHALEFDPGTLADSPEPAFDDGETGFAFYSTAVQPKSGAEAVRAEASVSATPGAVEDPFAHPEAVSAVPSQALQPVPIPASSPETSHASGEKSAGGLDPEVINEICRRVVSQLSESVIREIAWEVVPDCLERIVEQVARETLANKA